MSLQTQLDKKSLWCYHEFRFEVVVGPFWNMRRGQTDGGKNLDILHYYIENFWYFLDHIMNNELNLILWPNFQPHSTKPPLLNVSQSSLLRKLFDIFQNCEMSRPSQSGSVLSVTAQAGRWEEWGIRGSSREKIPAQGAFSIGFHNGAFRSPSSQQAS